MRRAFATLCLLILLGLGAWLLYPPEDAPPADSGREEQRKSRYTPDATLVGTKAEQEGEAKPAAPVAAASSASAQAPGPRILWKGVFGVKGAVEGQAFDPPATLTIHEHVMRFDSFMGFAPVEHELAKSGMFEIDMTTQLTEMAKRHSHETLLISLRLPGYMPLDRRVPISELKAIVAGTRTLPHLALILQPAGVVQGRVNDVEGRPLAEASALLYRMIDGAPASMPVSITTCGTDGRFSLPFAEEGRYLLVATFTQMGGKPLRATDRLLPASAQLDISRAATAAPVHLVLRRGNTLRGTVTVDGTVPHAAGLSWRLAGAATRLTVSRDGLDLLGLAYVDGEVHWGRGSARAAIETGRFEVHGLSPRPYEVRVERAQGMTMHPRARNQVERVVTPPRADLTFDLRLAHIRVLVRTPRGVPKGLKIGLSAVAMVPGLPEGVVWSSISAAADSHGRVRFDLQPESKWAVTVRDPRYETVVRLVASPAVGATTEVELDLVEVNSTPSLVVRLEGVGVDALFGAGFASSATSEAGGVTLPHALGGFIRPKGRQYRISNVEAGTWRLHVRPDRAWNSPPTTWLDAVVEVDVAATGDTAVRVPLTRGGRVHLDVTDSDGRYVKARCVLRDASGAALPVAFLSENDWGGRVLSRGTLPGAHDCWLMQALPVGTYTLHLALDGYRPEERRIVVRKGGTTLVQLVMAPLR